MRVFFRVDFGGLIGFGHMSRCLSLAKNFEEKNISCFFVVRKRPFTSALDLPFPIIWLNENKDIITSDVNSWRNKSEIDEAEEFLFHITADDIVVLDHYALGSSWQEKVKRHCLKLILFQDFFNENFHCHYLINYNLNAIDLYSKEFMNTKTNSFLLGSCFAPLDPDYGKEHLQWNGPFTEIKTIGISLGGIELKNLLKLATTLSTIEYFADKEIVWVLNNDDEVNAIQKIVSNINCQLQLKMKSLIPLYKKSDLFIGACGISLLERACLKKRQLNFVVADNQKNISDYITAHNLGIIIGDLRTCTHESLQKALMVFLCSPLEVYADKLYNKVDGLGASRIINEVIK